MLKVSRYSLISRSVSGKIIDFTPFVISMNLSWGLNASKASAKITLAQSAKSLIKTVKRGSAFKLSWGYNSSPSAVVTLYWIGTSWEINANVSIELVHKSWELARTPVRAVFTKTNADTAAKQLADKKGIKIKTEQSKKSSDTTRVINQTASEEITRQYKGQIIQHEYDGSSLKIVDFANLKDNAQVYYIDSQSGYTGNMTINYKAVVPKDKSYIEMLSGGTTNAEPLNNPSKEQSADPNPTTPPLPPGNYALLLSTGTKNLLDNPLLELKIIVAGEQIGSFPCVSGRAFKQDASKKDNVIPDGEYTIGSKLVVGFGSEFGGKFLGITPKFKTSRSGFGIHLDPSFNKKNGKDGTSGCIGLTTAADRDKVHGLLLEKNIKTLIVNLKQTSDKKDSSAESKPKAFAYFVGKLNDNTIIVKNNENQGFKAEGLFELFVVGAILKNKISLSDSQDDQIIGSLIQEVLSQSISPSSTDKLIKKLGGISALQAFISAGGFTASSIKGDQEQRENLFLSEASSTPKDLFNIFKDIFLKTDENYIIAQNYFSQNKENGLNLPGEIRLKSTETSSLSLIHSPSGEKYIVSLYAISKAQKFEVAKTLQPFLI